MKSSSGFALLAALAVVLPAQACPPQSQAKPPITQVASESRDVIVWERSGGIAGICQRLTIQSTGSYSVEDCIRQQPLKKGQLSRSQFASLQGYLNRYNRFEWELPQTPNSADMFAENYTFSGKGRRSPSAKEKEAINSMLSQLTMQLMDN